MMNRALVPEILHCTNHTTVLERQRARLKWQQQQQQHHHHHLQFQNQEQEDDSDCYNFNGAFQGFQGDLGEVVIRSVKHDPCSIDNAWTSDLVSFAPSGYANSHISFPISRTASCPPIVPAPVDATVAAKGRQNCDIGRESFKKRKVDKVLNNTKVVAEEESKDKRVKTFAEEGDSKITENTKNKSSNSSNSNSNSKKCNKENSAETSKDNSKITEIQKPDYIHVRARRGQATDSHSLAERVRREKISERMKYLQDLVPGCNKITGKAGMLDEIINYVQSLQRQVEFLSMKLAAVNPRLDFNIDNLFAKEIFPPCASNFASIGMSTTDMTSTAYLHQFNPVQQQQLVTCCGLEMGINPPDLGLRRTISAPVSNPETFIDSSCFTQMQGSSNWDGDLQNLYNVGFDEGRSTSFTTQSYTGCIETSNNLKMEM